MVLYRFLSVRKAQFFLFANYGHSVQLGRAKLRHWTVWKLLLAKIVDSFQLKLLFAATLYFYSMHVSDE